MLKSLKLKIKIKIVSFTPTTWVCGDTNRIYIHHVKYEIYVWCENICKIKCDMCKLLLIYLLRPINYDSGVCALGANLVGKIELCTLKGESSNSI